MDERALMRAGRRGRDGERGANYVAMLRFALLRESLNHAIGLFASSFRERVLTSSALQVNDTANVRLRASMRNLPQ